MLLVLNIEIYMFICSPQRSHSCQTPSCHHPIPPLMTCSQLWLQALDLTKHFKIQIPLFSWLWSWAHWALFEIGCLPARHPYSPKLILLHLMAKLAVPLPPYQHPVALYTMLRKPGKGDPAWCAWPSPCPSSHGVVRGLSCPGPALLLRRAVVGTTGTRWGSSSWAETLPSDSRGMSQIRSLQWEVAAGNLGTGGIFPFSNYSVVQPGTDMSLM